MSALLCINEFSFEIFKFPLLYMLFGDMGGRIFINK